MLLYVRVATSLVVIKRIRQEVRSERINANRTWGLQYARFWLRLTSDSVAYSINTARPFFTEQFTQSFCVFVSSRGFGFVNSLAASARASRKCVRHAKQQEDARGCSAQHDRSIP